MILGIGKAISSGAVRSREVLQKLKASGFVYSENGVLEFDAEKVATNLQLESEVGFE